MVKLDQNKCEIIRKLTILSVSSALMHIPCLLLAKQSTDWEDAFSIIWSWLQRHTWHSSSKGPIPLPPYAFRTDAVPEQIPPLAECIRFLTLLDPAANPCDSVRYSSIRGGAQGRENTWVDRALIVIDLNESRLLRRPSVKQSGYVTIRALWNFSLV